MKLILILTLFSIAIFAQQSRESNESIWDNIASGNYILDTVNDKGGLYIPIKKPNNETIYVPRDYGLMLNTINKPLFQFPKEACSSDQYKVDPPFVLKIDDYCDNLKDRPQNLDEKYLYLCLKSIREKLQTKPQDYTETIKRLLDLPVHEQEFAAAVFTGYGEGRSEADKEVALIFKTIENRTNYARSKGCTRANPLDIVLQRFQFSMWNKNDPNWKKALSLKEEENSEKEDLKRMVKVYKNYKNKKYSFTPASITNKIYHYRTKNIKKVPSWGVYSKAQKTVKVNGLNFGSTNRSKAVAHYFFKNVAWSFSYHPYRRMYQGEKGCY